MPSRDGGSVHNGRTVTNGMRQDAATVMAPFSHGIGTSSVLPTEGSCMAERNVKRRTA